MKIIVKHIIKNIFEKKLRSSIVLLTILLSTLVLFVGLSLNSIINQTYTTMLQGAYGTSNILFSKSVDDGNPLYEPNDVELEGITPEHRLDMIQASGKTTLNEELKTISLIGMDIEVAKQMDLIKILAEDEQYGSSVVISQRTATKYQLSIGDLIQVEHGNQIIDYRVAAISKPNGIFYSEMDNPLFITKSESIHEHFYMENLFSSTLLEVEDDTVDFAITSLTENNSFFTVEKTSDADTMLRDEQTFQTVMMLSIIIIVLISAYVISSLTKLIVAERMPVMGTFRSVGASKGMMNRVLLLEFLVYGLIGAILGIIFSIVLLPYAANVFNEYKEYGIETVVDYNLSYLILSFSFGVIFPALISLLRIINASRKPLREVLFDTSFTPEKYSKGQGLLGLLLLVLSFVLNMVNQYDELLPALVSLLLLFISIVLLMPTLLSGISYILRLLLNKSSAGELKLGVKNIAGSKIVANNVSMIMVVFLLLMMVGIASTGIDNYVTNTLSKDFDVSVSLSKSDLAIADEIREIDGISDSYIQKLSLGQSENSDVSSTFAVYGVNDFKEIDAFYDGITYFELDEERISNLENPVILDEYYMDKFGIVIGDTVEIQPVDLNYQPIDNTAPIKMVVSGKMDSSGFNSSRDSAFIPLEIYDERFEGIFEELTLKLEAGYEAEEIKETIENTYINYSLEVLTFDEMIGSQKATIDTLIDGITVIIGLGMIVGILGISNNLIVSFNQRKKEYAVLYSVCMSRGQIVKLLFIETLMMFLAVVVIGSFGGIVLNIFLTKLLHAIGMVTEFNFAFGLFGFLCIVVFILLIISTLSLVRKIFKLNIMEELRYE